MPRIVVTCGACNRKHATSAIENPFICSDCRRSEVEERQTPAPLRRRLELTPLSFKRARADEFDSKRNHSPDDVGIEDSQFVASVVQKLEEDARSEASDDWKCTQLCDEDDGGSNLGVPASKSCTSDGDDKYGDAGSDDDLDDRPLIQLASNSSCQHVAESASSAAAVSTLPSMSETDLGTDLSDLVEDDFVLRSLDNAKLRDTTVCLICGSSLLAIQSLKGRLNHMKRCSKKSGVSAKDIRWNDDHEMFVSASTSARRSPLKDAIRNPYAKHSLSAPASVAAERESASVLSITNVLMAGARLAAKRKKVETENATVAAAATKRPGRRPWWQVRDQQPKRACPWYKMISNTDFCVDGFNYVANTRNFFLSHFHSDHYGGITSSWDSGTIYCSMVTANLVSQQLGVDRKFLHPIPMLTPVVIESKGKPVTVVAIDANHCPGAVMFLFQVGTKNVLHVGDFRWNRSIMQECSQLNPFFSGQSSLDCIYLDTTYCDEKYALPTQDEAIREAIAVASREFDLARRSKQSLLLLFGAYTIGKERIYMYVLTQALQILFLSHAILTPRFPSNFPGPWHSI
jgi:hypothetical protein